VHSEVEALLDELVRPLIEADGGNLELVSVTEDTVVVRLLGACAGCPGAPYTRSKVIEPVVQRILPKATIKLERRPTSPQE